MVIPPLVQDVRASPVQRLPVLRALRDLGEVYVEIRVRRALLLDLQLHVGRVPGRCDRQDILHLDGDKARCPRGRLVLEHGALVVGEPDVDSSRGNVHVNQAGVRLAGTQVGKGL